MLDVRAIRKDFPVLQRIVNGKPLVYLDNAAMTQLPRPVMKTLEEQLMGYNANVHRGIHYLSEKSTERLENGRIIVQNFINAAYAHEIIFTKGTTDAVNMLSCAFGELFVFPEDEIIVSEMEHHSNLVPWQMLCRRRGARLKVIPFDDNGDLIISQYKKLLSERAKLVAVTHVSNVLGSVNPVKNIISLAHDFNVPVLVDGAQSIRHEIIDVQDINCDFFCFSGHKMMAPAGIGVLYGKEKWLEKMNPVQFGGGMVDSVSIDKASFGTLPLKFEAGTHNVAGAVALGAAGSYLEMIGRENINTYETALMEHLCRSISGIDGLKILGNPLKRAGVLSFNLENIHPYDIAVLLDNLGIAVRSGNHCAQPLLDHYHLSHTVRVSPAFYNTKEEINFLIQAINRIKTLIEK